MKRKEKKEIKQNVIMTSIASWILTSPLAMRIKSIEMIANHRIIYVGKISGDTNDDINQAVKYLELTNGLEANNEQSQNKEINPALKYLKLTNGLEVK
ncbi:MAG TPA: hypothetical protein IAB56_00385 [Candidatus Scybalousia intestinigallinarum]|nr:hypothetical protein [Candidatus Scybalousia intestinigallinarum]